jgi:hypothetical protein
MSSDLPAIMPNAESENPLVPVAPATLELLERAQIDVQIATAKKWGRPELPKIREKIQSFATDEETAERCFYTLKRFDAATKETKLIQGPSVRLAEIAVVCYRNIWAGARTTDNDGRKVTSQGVCWDLENNVRIFSEDIRRIIHKDGRPYSEDMQIMAAKACNAIARRNAIFQVIPMALIAPVYEECKRVAVGDASTMQVKRDKIFKRFYSMGVEQDQILRVLGKESLESVDLEDLGNLIGLGTAIRDHEISIEEAFALPADEEGQAAPVKSRLRDLRDARRVEKIARGEVKDKPKGPEAAKAPEPEKPKDQEKW